MRLSFLNVKEHVIVISLNSGLVNLREDVNTNNLALDLDIGLTGRTCCFQNKFLVSGFFEFQATTLE